MAARGPDRRVIAVAVAIPALALLGVLATALLGGDGDETATAGTTTTTTTTTVAPATDEAWDDAVADAFAPLAEVLPPYARAVDEWSAGGRSDGELAAALDEVEPVVHGVAAATRALPGHRRDELAGGLVEAAAELYVQAVVDGVENDRGIVEAKKVKLTR